MLSRPFLFVASCLIDSYLLNLEAYFSCSSEIVFIFSINSFLRAFVVSLGILGGWLPLGFAVVLTGLELLVAFIQAYVFAILTCIYLNDALNLHH